MVGATGNKRPLFYCLRGGKGEGARKMLSKPKQHRPLLSEELSLVDNEINVIKKSCG